MRAVFFLVAALGGLLFWALVAVCAVFLVFAVPSLLAGARRQREGVQGEEGGIDGLF